MWALFVARNFEFIRDRAGFGWNILFPFLIVAGFGVIFSSDSRSEFKLGVFPVKQNSMTVNELKIPEKLKTYDHIKIVPFETHEEAMDKLRNSGTGSTIRLPRDMCWKKWSRNPLYPKRCLHPG